QLFLQLARSGVFRPHDDDVTAILPLDGGRRLITAGWEGHVKVWSTADIAARELDKTSGNPETKPLKTLPGRFACLSEDGKRLAVAEAEGVRIYDTATFSETSWTPTDPRLGKPARVKFSRDGKLLAATMCACTAC